MTFQSQLKRFVHKKQWEMLDPIPTATVAGAFYVKDPIGIRKTALAVFSATVQYLYNIEEDSHVQISSLALSGTFGAGACGVWGRWSNTLTANGGSIGTVTLSTNINGLCVDRKIRFVTGLNAGLERDIADVKIIPGGTNTIYFKTDFPNAVANNDTFIISTGRYWIMNAGTIAAGIFKSYDPLTGVATSLATTGLPATWGTDGRLVGTPSYFAPYSIGNVASATGTTLTATGKIWTLNQFANFQVRITAGTGAGQLPRTIVSNTVGGQLTVSSAWTINPDATSQFAIETNDDFLYLLGNNAVTVYKYQISTNTWTTITPTVARVGAFATGGSANFIAKTGNAKRADETNIQDGRYIYSFRGGATALLDRFDIALLAWGAVTYTNNGETFTTGSSYDADGCRIYARKDATHRFFYYCAVGNTMFGFARNLTADGVALVGDKLFTCSYVDPDTQEYLTWLYTVGNTSTLLYRMLVI